METESETRLDQMEGLIRKALDEIGSLRREICEIKNGLEKSEFRYKSLNDFESDSHIPKLESDQTFKVINLLNRLNRVDRRLRKSAVHDDTGFKLKELRETVYSAIDPILDGEDLLNSLGEVNQKVREIEELAT